MTPDVVSSLSRKRTHDEAFPPPGTQLKQHWRCPPPKFDADNIATPLHRVEGSLSLDEREALRQDINRFRRLLDSLPPLSSGGSDHKTMLGEALHTPPEHIFDQPDVPKHLSDDLLEALKHLSDDLLEALKHLSDEQLEEKIIECSKALEQAT